MTTTSTSTRRRATAAWALALVALTAGACGSGSDETSSDGMSSDTRPPAEREERDDDERTTTTTRAPSTSTTTTTEATSGTAGTPTVPAGWVEFDDGGARMAIPSTWTPEPSGGLPDQTAPTYIYLDGLGVEFRRNINLITQPVGGMDLAGYVRTSDAQLAQLADTIIEQGPTELSGQPAHRWRYTATFAEANNLQVEVLSVAVVIDGLAWLVTYTATPDGFAAGLPEVEQFLTTVQLPG